MSQKFFVQCELEKRYLADGARTARTTSWIPERFSKVGTVLKLKDKNGGWSDGWIVTQAFSRLSRDQLPDAHGDARGHRKATGDSLPKI